MSHLHQTALRSARLLGRALPELVSVTLVGILASDVGRAQCGVEALAGAASDGADQLGASIATRGDLLVVGAPRADQPGSTDGLEGRVFVFADVGGTWVEEAVLQAPAGQPIDDFGAAVAVDGDRVAVGAPGRDGAHADQGAVFVFERQGGAWNLVVELTAIDAQSADRLGTSVALVGSTVYAGAPGHDFFGAGDGAVYGFDLVGSTGVLSAKFVDSSLPAGPNRFGEALATDGLRIAVGAPAASGASAFGGAASVFAFHPVGPPTLERTVVAPLAVPGSFFGAAVSLAGGDLVVGADGNGPAGTGSGSAWWIDLDDPRSTPLELALPDHAPGDAAGAAVLVAGNELFVGRPRRSVLAPLDGGVVRFERQAATWVATDQLLAPTAADRPGFGSALAIDGDRLAVGAPEQAGGGAGFSGFQAGRTYVLDLPIVLGDLTGCPPALSLADGGLHDLVLRDAPVGGPAVFLLGVSGSSPGVPLDGLVLPLNVDALTLAALSTSSPIAQPIQVVDALGEARALLELPAGSDPALAGTLVLGATLTLDPTAFGVADVAGAVTLDLVP